MIKAIAAMLVIAGSALLLAVALKKISEIGNFGTMMQSVVALLAIVAILTGGAMLISMGGNSLMQAGIGLLALVAAILLVVASLDKITEAFQKLSGKTTGLKDDVLIIAATMTALAIAIGVVYLVTKKVASGLWQVAAIILSIGAAIFLIALAVERLTKIDDGALGKAAEILVALVGAIAVLALISRIFPKNGVKGILGMAAAIMAIGIAVSAIVGALVMLTMLGPKAESALELLGGIVTMLAVLLVSAAGIKPKTGGAIFGMAALILAIVGAMVILAHQDYAKMLTSAMMLGAVLLVLGRSLRLTGAALSGGKFTNILGIIGIVATIAGSLYLLTRVDAGNLLGAVIAIAATMLAFAYGMKIASNALAGANIGSLIAAIASFAIIALLLAGVASMPTEGILAAARGLSVVMLVLAFSLAAINKTSAQTVPAKTLASMIFAVGAMISIAKALEILAQQDTSRLISATIAMATVLAVLAVVMPIMSRMDIPSVGDSFKIVLFITAVLAPIAAALGILASTHIDANRMVTMATAMAEVMVALAAPIAAIGLLGKLGFKSSMIGLGSFAAIVGGLTLIFAGLGALVEKFEGEEGNALLDKVIAAKELMTAIGGALGGMIGGFVAGFGGVVFDSIASWGEDIKTFLSSLSEGVDGLNQLEIDEGKMSALESFGNAILTITKAEILDGITSWITGGPDFTKFADGIAKMAPALKTFATETEGLDSTKIEPAAKAIESLSNVAKNLGRTGGVFEGLTGKAKSLGDFASDMSKAAPKLNKFAQEMSKEDGFAMKDDKVIAAAKAIQAMSDVAQSLGTTGGILEHITGKARSLADFAGELKDTIPDLQAFAAAAPGLASAKADIEKVAGAIGAMIEVANALVPEHEENFWTGHVKDAQTLGEFFDAFSDSGLEASANLGSLEAGFKIEGKKGITSSLIEFANQMAEINLDGIDKGTQAIGKFIEIGNMVAGSEDNIKILGGLVYSKTSGQENGLKNLADMLKDIAPTFGEFASYITDNIDLSAFDLFSSAIKTLANAEVWLSNLEYGGGTMETFAAELWRSAESFANAANIVNGAPLDALQTWLTWITENYDGLLIKGKEAVQAVQDGMTTAAELGAIDVADKTVNPVFDRLTSAMNELKARAAGKFLVDGFAGITANIHTAMAAAGNLSEATIQQMRRTLRIGSPSRVARQIGDWTGEGFTIGVSDWLHASGQVGESLAESVTKSAEATVDYLTRLLNGDMVVSKTIRPVLDLTDVRNGAMTIDSMFTQRQALMAQLDSSAMDQSAEIAELVNVSWQILREIQNGRDIYLDGRVLAGSMNRRLGRMEGL